MRAGVTLLELMLVLALLVAIASMSLPAFTGPMLNQQLRKSGDLVRAEWSRARNRAMKDGQAYSFRFQPGTGKYRIEPWETGNEYLESSAPIFSGVAGLAAGPSPIEKSLPDRIVFHSGALGMDSRDALVQGQGAMTELNDGSWSTPILFYPDGTSSNAELLVMSDRGSFVRVKLRGLTGIALSSDVLTAQELGP